MDEPTHSFRIQWKGLILGPYSRQEVENNLRAGEISLLHRIEVDGHWESVADFLFERPELKPVSRESELELAPLNLLQLPGERSGVSASQSRRLWAGQIEQLVLVGYVLCGTAFVLPGLATLPALWVASRVRRAGAAEPARLQFILCGLFTVLGVLFYLFLHHVREQGWV